MADRFFTPDPLAVGEFVLTGPEAHHLATVRRFEAGDRVTLFNGNGFEYAAEIVAVAKKQVVLTILAEEQPERELPFALEIAAAMPKGDRGDFLIEKLVELGVTRFTPLETTRTIVVPKPARIENLQQAVIEASKQCGRNVLMRIEPVTKWPAFLARADLPGSRLILATGSTMPISAVNRDVVLAVGPEGGWEPQEIEMAEQAGWQRTSLGPRVLRVETAAIAGATAIGTHASQ